MKTLNKFLYATMASAMLFVSCSDDDTVSDDDGGIMTDNLISSQDDPDLNPNALQGDVVANVTLSAAQTWTLTGPLAVKDGFTLTIEPGTRIEAVAGGTNIFVVVEQGAQINADGTAAQPIIFTSAAANPRAGDWGGILINGFAQISGGGTSTTEVLPLSYGGDDDNDNSGIMDYVLIEYTGARINGEREFNGLTLYAVGDATTISNIAINAGDDDAIEFFGGTVNVQNLLVVDARDDMFDWTQGFRSSGNTNWYGLRRSSFTAISEDTRGIEGDGNLDGNSPDDMNQSNVAIDGITIINSGIIEMADMIKIRRGSNALITNAFIALNNEDAAASDLIDFTDGRGNAFASASVTGTASTANGLNISDISNPDGQVATITASMTASVDVSIFAWTGLDLSEGL